MTPAIVQAPRRTAQPERQAISLISRCQQPGRNFGNGPRITLMFCIDGMVHASACGSSRLRTFLLDAQYLDSAVDRDETSNAVKFDLGQLLKQRLTSNWVHQRR